MAEIKGACWVKCLKCATTQENDCQREVENRDVGKKKRWLRQRANWKEDHITDVVNIQSNIGFLTNNKKASSTDAYEKGQEQLNTDCNATT